MSAVGSPAVQADKILLEKRSLYSNILVKQNGSTVCLLFHVRTDQRNQSCINQRKPKHMVFNYTRMSMSALLFTPDPAAVLVVGLGGGTLPTALNELYPNAQIDALEIDPAVVDVAREFFGLQASAQLRVHTSDARIWVRRAAARQRQFDIIILDAFNGEYIPEHLMTREFFSEIQQLLSPRGVMVANTFSISDLYDHESATYAEVFGDFINFKLPESANRVIIAPRTAVPDNDLDARARALARTLKPYGIPIERYSRIIRRQRGAKPDWRTTARVLTDQYSPANLLQGR